MTEEAQGRRAKRSKLWIAALALLIFVALIVIPPLVSINRYKTRIARAVSASVGRPVHLSGVELRLFPRPGFVITDLTIEEDPAYGAEPVLRANEVTASLRLLSLWRGKLEMSRISVDEASLNLVRTTDGRWNLDTLFRTAAQSQPGEGGRRRVPLPYLEATNSRINIKRGYEKLPYSLVNADLSFWEEDPGDWRFRLKGQPARTDVELQLGDTGIVQLEGRMRRAAELRLMPVHIEMEWRAAQLGQLSRLLIGSDPGWRGDLTAEMKLDGTAESAQVTTRLRATGVHRAEFAPAVPLDFDANCNFAYHYSVRTIDNLVCDSPLGDGRLRVEGNIPSNGQPRMSLQLQRIPAQAILDALRTVRSEFGASLEADGSLSGELIYDTSAPVEASQMPATTVHRSRRLAKSAPATPAATSPLTGSITLDGLRLTGGSLSQPIQIQKVVLEPAASTESQGDSLAGTASLSAGAPTPLVFTASVTLTGYHVSVRGAGSPSRVRQLAHAAGLKEAGAIDTISGDPVTLDLSIEGPWLPAPDESLAETVGEIPSSDLTTAQPLPDRLTGTVILHNATWKTGVLPNPVDISQATLHLNGGTSDWDPVAFSYGPLSGLAHLQIPAPCAEPAHCIPTVNLEFPTLDAAELQSALLGSEKKTLLSTVIARLTPASNNPWPAFQGTVKAGSLKLGPIALQSFAADIKVNPVVADINAIDGGLLGGQVHLSGKVEAGDKPSYTLEGSFQNVNPAELCRILALKCSGAGLDGDGRIELAGYDAKDLAASAKGAIHFVWKKGGVAGHATSTDAPPPLLVRFDKWTADAEIAGGAATLRDNQVQQGKRVSPAKATVTFTDPPKVSFASAGPDTPSKK